MKTYYEQYAAMVLPRMTDWQTDVTDHDKATLAEYDGEFIAAARKTGTWLAKVTPFMEAVRNVRDYGFSSYFPERDRQEFFNGTFGNPWDFLIDPHSGNQWWFHGKDGQVTELTCDQAKALIDDLFSQVQEIQKEITQKYPDRIIKYEIIDLTNGALDKIREFAKTHNLTEQFEKDFSRFHNYVKAKYFVELYSDFAPMSLTFATKDSTGKTSTFGGFIFHGAHDGGGNGSAPTYSVSLNPQTKPHWSIHT